MFLGHQQPWGKQTKDERTHCKCLTHKQYLLPLLLAPFRGSNWCWDLHKISLLENKQGGQTHIFWFQIPHDFHSILCHPRALMEVESKCKGTGDGGTMGLKGQIRSKCSGGVSLEALNLRKVTTAVGSNPSRHICGKSGACEGFVLFFVFWNCWWHPKDY